MKDNLVLYHASCSDGFAAAWVMKMALGETADYKAVQYGQGLPIEVFGYKSIYIVDFSYSRQVLEGLHAQVPVIVLDHHKTAREALEGLDYCHFDMERSGAMMAWDYCYGTSRDSYDARWSSVPPRPWIVDYVQDRDLWRHMLPNSKDINAAIGSWVHDFQEWDARLAIGTRHAAMEGVGIRRMQQQAEDSAMGWAYDVPALRFIEEERRKLAASVSRAADALARDKIRDEMLALSDLKVPIINITGKNISEVVGRLAKGRAFAVGWFRLDAETFVYSLRSDENGMDVSEIAKSLGGGGHARAAGFKSTRALF